MTAGSEHTQIEYKRLALGIYLPGFLRVFGAALCGTFVPLYLADMEASLAAIGAVMAAQSAGLLAADLPAGLLVSRLGTRRSMILGLLGMGSALALAGAVRGVLLLGVFLFVAGFCSALVQISQLTIMRHAMPDHARGRALALFGGSMRLGRVMAPLLGGILVQVAGYRSVLWCYAAMLTLSCALFCWFGPRRQVAAAPPEERVLAGVRRLLRENWRVLLPAGGTLLMLALLRTSRNVLLPLWGRDIGLTPAKIGMIVSAGAAVDTLFFPLSGYISDKKGRKWSLACCIGFFSCGILALAAYGGSVTGFVAAVVVIGIGNGLGSGINMTVGSDLAPKGKDAGPFLGLWRVITDTGGMLGPSAVGGIGQCLALGPAAIVIALAGFGSVALMARFMPEPKGFRR